MWGEPARTALTRSAPSRVVWPNTAGAPFACTYRSPALPRGLRGGTGSADTVRSGRHSPEEDLVTDIVPAGVQRRVFLKRGLATAAALAALGPLEALGARTAGAAPMTRRPSSPDYGPLRPVTDQTTGLALLSLPAGFEYLSYGWTGDIMSDGTRTPGAHDGMAAFRRPDGKVALVRTTSWVATPERSPRRPTTRRRAAEPRISYLIPTRGSSKSRGAACPARSATARAAPHRGVAG